MQWPVQRMAAAGTPEAAASQWHWVYSKYFVKYFVMKGAIEMQSTVET